MKYTHISSYHVLAILILIKTTMLNVITGMNEKVIFCQFYCFAILHGLKNTYMRVFYMKWPWNWKIIRALITFSRQGIIGVWSNSNEKNLDIIQLTAYRNGMRATCGVNQFTFLLYCLLGMNCNQIPISRVIKILPRQIIRVERFNNVLTHNIYIYPQWLLFSFMFNRPKIWPWPIYIQ